MNVYLTNPDASFYHTPLKHFQKGFMIIIKQPFNQWLPLLLITILYKI